MTRTVVMALVLLFPILLNGLGWYLHFRGPASNGWRERISLVGLATNLVVATLFCALVFLESNSPGLLDIQEIVITKGAGLILSLLSAASAILGPARTRMALLSASVFAGLLWSIVGAAFL